MKYESKESTNPNWHYIARHNDDGTTSIIPIEPANSDYQAYLRWLNGEEEQSGTL